MGDGRAEGASETGDRGQAAIPYQQLMAQVLVPCWIQLSTFLKEQSSDV